MYRIERELFEEVPPYVTIKEIVERWRKHPTTVRRALDAKHKPLQGYKSPDSDRGVWLISWESVCRRWGKPA